MITLWVQFLSFSHCADYVIMGRQCNFFHYFLMLWADARSHMENDTFSVQPHSSSSLSYNLLSKVELPQPLPPTDG